MGTEIEIHHAVQRPIAKPVSGSLLHDIEIKNLVWNATDTLNRENGYFFEVINDVFAIGFLSEWSMDNGAPRGGEFYYDIFSIDSTVISDIDLTNLVNELKKITVNSPHEDHKSIRKLTVNSQKDYVQRDTTEIIAKTITQLRQDEKAYASLEDVSVFVTEIDNALGYAKFISDERASGGYFNLIEGVYDKSPDPELMNRIQNLSDEEMSIDDLLSDEGIETPPPQTKETSASQNEQTLSPRKDKPNTMYDDRNSHGYVEKSVQSLVEDNDRYFIALILILLVNLIILLALIILIYSLDRNGVIDITDLFTNFYSLNYPY
jgi:hypothetical protein